MLPYYGQREIWEKNRALFLQTLNVSGQYMCKLDEILFIHKAAADCPGWVCHSALKDPTFNELMDYWGKKTRTP